MDVLKIDRSFVSRIEESEKDKILVSTMVDLARALDLAVVAEGIETAGQRALLEELGCNLGQGFYFARPLDDRTASELLAADRRVTGASPRASAP